MNAARYASQGMRGRRVSSQDIDLVILGIDIFMQNTVIKKSKEGQIGYIQIFVTSGNPGKCTPQKMKDSSFIDLVISGLIYLHSHIETLYNHYGREWLT